MLRVVSGRKSKKGCVCTWFRQVRFVLLREKPEEPSVFNRNSTHFNSGVRPRGSCPCFWQTLLSLLFGFLLLGSFCRGIQSDFMENAWRSSNSAPHPAATRSTCKKPNLLFVLWLECPVFGVVRLAFCCIFLVDAYSAADATKRHVLMFCRFSPSPEHWRKCMLFSSISMLTLALHRKLFVVGRKPHGMCLQPWLF